jgi:uncharacterized membrane protein
LEANFLAEIHPKVVHFPVALLTTYSILEIIGIVFNKEFITKSALLVLCLGVVTSLFAVLTGNQAAANFVYWTDDSLALLNNHQSSATYLLWTSAIVCGLRIIAVIKKKFVGLIKYVFAFLAIVILLIVFKTGSYGGDLVKKYGIGTDVYQNEESE